MPVKNIFISFVLLFVHAFLFAQSNTISGTINNSGKEPVIGASIVSLPSGKGTVSNEKGYFSLAIEPGDTRLRITAVNYQPHEIAIDQRVQFEVTLTPAAGNLSEVVLVGTRAAGRTRLNTPAPVDIFNVSRLQLTAPQNDINQLLQYASPSFNSNRQSSSDGTEHICCTKSPTSYSLCSSATPSHLNGMD